MMSRCSGSRGYGRVIPHPRSGHHQVSSGTDRLLTDGLCQWLLIPLNAVLLSPRAAANWLLVPEPGPPNAGVPTASAMLPLPSVSAVLLPMLVGFVASPPVAIARLPFPTENALLNVPEACAVVGKFG